MGEEVAEYNGELRPKGMLDEFGAKRVIILYI
jgi:pyruvate/2-oxoglutarate/acetoin dehydrogenase E1 component